MKRYRFFVSLTLLALILTASLSINHPVSAAASDLFISEYIEGTSFNKAIEIYNGTGAAVDLSTYTVELYSNGAASPSQSVALSGSLADGDVFVLAHASADPAILAVTDLTNSAVINFNGDDAIVLRNSGAVVDAFGQIGVDPGTEWPNGGVDDTLVRAETVCAGDTIADDAFDASLEWVASPINTFSNLGSHTADCGNGGGGGGGGGTTAEELFLSEYIEGSSFNKAIEIYNGTGSDVDLAAGNYTLELYSNGAVAPNATAVLAGTIAAGDVYVVAHASADPAILAEADLQNSSVINFNGDDAVVLRKDGAVIDAFGQTGFDPGTEWAGGGQDDTLVRVETVCAGDTIADDAFDASAEWIPFANNTFDNLGSHTAVCGGARPEVIINEVDSDTDGTDVLEFVELYDGGFGNTPLDGLTVVFYNGSNDLSYAAYDLDGFSTDANGYFLLGNVDVVPTPSIIFSSNGLQNGADAVALYQDDAANFPNNTAVTTTNLLDAIVYDTSDADDPELLALLNAGQPQVNEGGAGNSAADSNQRCANGSGGRLNTSTYAQFAPTPGADNICEIVEPPLSCETPNVATMIYDIQGSGPSSALDGTAVVIDGVVVGDFQENDGDHTDLDGFYVQDPVGDGNPATSDGIFVFAPGAINVVPGDLVRVSGVVDEFFDMTEITNVNAVLLCGTGSVAPTPITIPTDLEPYEGMLVTLDQTMYISEFFNFDRFGEIFLTTDRQYQPTAVYEPGSPEAAALAAANVANRITLDDGRTSQNPDPAIHPNGLVFDQSNLFRGGDTLDNVTGVIDYRFDLYRLQPTQGADYTPMNPRTAVPDPVGGSLKVASFNVLNYFNGDGMGGGFPTSRGADDLNEFNRQRDKIIAALVAIDADVVGLMEIENDGYGEFSAIADLVNGLNDATAPGTYAYINPGVTVIGTDEIAVGLIYKPGTVTPQGASAILDSSIDSRFDDTKNRPALAQSFMENSSGEIFTVAVNHLKSKGSDCNDVNDPDLGDGAGNCNLTRQAAAQALVDWLAADPTGSGDPDALIIGDLNSYDKEDPIDAILAGPDDLLGTEDDYTDLAFAFGGEFAYSYVFDGQLGYLDYALANSSLAEQVTGATEWHINADEADLLDYDTSFKLPAQAALYQPDAYRASDHDPVIIGLSLSSGPAQNADGCYIVALDGSPYDGPATTVSASDPGYNGFRFYATLWGRSQGLDRWACYEIHGTNSSEIIFGGNTNDTIYGYGSYDLLFGLFGNDTFSGGEGPDLIDGGLGRDELLDYEWRQDVCISVEDGCRTFPHWPFFPGRW
ncbi:MAG: ExeM/NucH family extracellular endonuclease [Chloroflexota bacterium]